jgi:hypothetical protein
VEKRICPLCNIEPEDEIHFILKCPKLDECRKELFSNISSVIWMSSKNLNSPNIEQSSKDKTELS